MLGDIAILVLQFTDSKALLWELHRLHFIYCSLGFISTDPERNLKWKIICSASTTRARAEAETVCSGVHTLLICHSTSRVYNYMSLVERGWGWLLQSCKEEQKRNSFGSARNNCTVKTMKLATLVSQPHCTGTGKFLWRYTWSLRHNLATCLSLILVTVSHFVPCYLQKGQPPYVGRPKELYSFCIILFVGRNPRSAADVPAVHPTSILSPQVLTIHCNSLVETDYCT